MFDKIDFKSGVVRFCCDADEKAYFDEDMLQVDYPNNFILDFGWYGDESGFIIYIIKDSNWTVPIVKYIAQSQTDAIDFLVQAVQRIQVESVESKPWYGALWKTEVITK